MTQFALASLKKYNFESKSLVKVEGDFLSAIAAELFPNISLSDIYTLDVDGKDIDSLMLDAQKDVIDGIRFQETMLYDVVSELAASISELFLWYGSDYDDIDYVYDVPALLDIIESAVSDSACEVYVRYKKNENL